MPLTGSIHACVPYAPPCPCLPGESISATPVVRRAQPTQSGVFCKRRSSYSSPGFLSFMARNSPSVRRFA